MARIRTITPGFWEDDAVGVLTRDARLLFIATWNLADDEGLLRWNSEYLKANAFMYDDDLSAQDVASLMAELVGQGMVFPYKGGKTQTQFALVVNFKKHQRINRPTPARLPPPSLQSPAVRQMYMKRDEYRCHLCGELVAEWYRERGLAVPTTQKVRCWDSSIDHVVPRSKGGSDYPSNLRTAHESCNKSKKDSDPPAETRAGESRKERLTESLTESLMEPSLLEEEKEEEWEEEGKHPLVEQPASLTLVPLPDVSPDGDRVGRIFNAWLDATGKKRAVLDTKRRRLINTALKTYPEADLIDAVRGWRNSPHHAGQNDNGTIYNDLGLLLRDAAHIERFRDLERGHQIGAALAPQLSRNTQFIAARIADARAKEISQ